LRAHRNDFEFKEQAALFKWARNPIVLKKYPELKLLEGSMNGVHLSRLQAAKAKLAGLLKGSHDVTLPIARGDHIGLSIELKYGKNQPTKEQLDIAELLQAEGHQVAFCWSWDDARVVIEKYLEQENKRK